MSLSRSGEYNKSFNENSHDLDFLCSAIAFTSKSLGFKVQLLSLFINTPSNILSSAWLLRIEVELQNKKTSLDRENGNDGNDYNLCLIICCTAFGGNHCNQGISVTLTETCRQAFGPLLMIKLLQLLQGWRLPSPHCLFQLLPQMFNSILIRAHIRPLFPE